MCASTRYNRKHQIERFVERTDQECFPSPSHITVPQTLVSYFGQFNVRDRKCQSRQQEDISGHRRGRTEGSSEARRRRREKFPQEIGDKTFEMEMIWRGTRRPAGGGGNLHMEGGRVRYKGGCSGRRGSRDGDQSEKMHCGGSSSGRGSPLPERTQLLRKNEGSGFTVGT